MDSNSQNNATISIKQHAVNWELYDWSFYVSHRNNSSGTMSLERVKHFAKHMGYSDGDIMYALLSGGKPCPVRLPDKDAQG